MSLITVQLKQPNACTDRQYTGIWVGGFIIRQGTVFCFSQIRTSRHLYSEILGVIPRFPLPPTVPYTASSFPLTVPPVLYLPVLFSPSPVLPHTVWFPPYCMYSSLIIIVWRLAPDPKNVARAMWAFQNYIQNHFLTICMLICNDNHVFTNVYDVGECLLKQITSQIPARVSHPQRRQLQEKDASLQTQHRLSDTSCWNATRSRPDEQGDGRRNEHHVHKDVPGSYKNRTWNTVHSCSSRQTPTLASESQIYASRSANVLLTDIQVTDIKIWIRIIRLTL